MLNKKQQRLKRARQTRHRIRSANKPRLAVFRSNLHIYAQLMSGDGSSVLAAASTAEKDIRGSASANGGNVSAAQMVGKRIAEKARVVGIESVAFDRAGYAYHGRVKALAEAAREAGLKF